MQDFLKKVKPVSVFNIPYIQDNLWYRNDYPDYEGKWDIIEVDMRNHSGRQLSELGPEEIIIDSNNTPTIITHDHNCLGSSLDLDGANAKVLPVYDSAWNDRYGCYISYKSVVRAVIACSDTNLTATLRLLAPLIVALR